MSYSKPTLNERLNVALQIKEDELTLLKARVQLLEKLVTGLMDYLKIKPVFEEDGADHVDECHPEFKAPDGN